MHCDHDEQKVVQMSVGALIGEYTDIVSSGDQDHGNQALVKLNSSSVKMMRRNQHKEKKKNALDFQEIPEHGLGEAVGQELDMSIAGARIANVLHAQHQVGLEIEWHQCLYPTHSLSLSLPFSVSLSFFLPSPPSI